MKVELLVLAFLSGAFACLSGCDAGIDHLVMRMCSPSHLKGLSWGSVVAVLSTAYDELSFYSYAPSSNREGGDPAVPERRVMQSGFCGSYHCCNTIQVAGDRFPADEIQDVCLMRFPVFDLTTECDWLYRKYSQGAKEAPRK